MIDGAEEYRAEPCSERNAGRQTNIFPVNSGQRSWLKSWCVHVKDRLQVAICEPVVEVDDDGDIFGRQRINGTDRIFLRWTLLATWSRHSPHALHDSSLARIKDWTVLLYSVSLIVNFCMFYLFVNKYLYVTIRLMVTKHQSTTQFERTSYSIYLT